jgi:hypothetical protein
MVENNNKSVRLAFFPCKLKLIGLDIQCNAVQKCSARSFALLSNAILKDVSGILPIISYRKLESREFKILSS